MQAADLQSLSEEVESVSSQSPTEKQRSSIPECMDIKIIFQEQPLSSTGSNNNLSGPSIYPPHMQNPNLTNPPNSNNPTLQTSSASNSSVELIEAHPIKRLINHVAMTLSLKQLLQDLTVHCNLSFENKEILFYLKDCQIFMNCGIQPISSDVKIHVRDFISTVEADDVKDNNGPAIDANGQLSLNEHVEQIAIQNDEDKAAQPKKANLRQKQSMQEIIIKVKTLSNVHMLHKLMAKDNTITGTNNAQQKSTQARPLSQMPVDLDEDDDDDNSQSHVNNQNKASHIHNPQRKAHTNKKSRRTKERRIGFIIQKVIQWRNYYSGVKNQNNQHMKMSLEDAAKQVKISKKSLDDYLFQIRFGHNCGFNFNEHYNSKVGVLRRFVKQKKNLQNTHLANTKQANKQAKREEKMEYHHN